MKTFLFRFSLILLVFQPLMTSGAVVTPSTVAETSIEKPITQKQKKKKDLKKKKKKKRTGLIARFLQKRFSKFIPGNGTFEINKAAFFLCLILWVIGLLIVLAFMDWSDDSVKWGAILGLILGTLVIVVVLFFQAFLGI